MAYIRKRNRRIFLIFMVPAILVLFCTTIYPMLYAGYLSFRSYDLAKLFVPRIFVGWANYREILSSSEFLHTLTVTFKLMLMTLSVQLVLGVGLALLVTQRLPGMGVIRTLLLIPMMISPVIVGLVWLFLYFPELGYLNYFLSFFGVSPIPWITSTQWALWAIAMADIWQRLIPLSQADPDFVSGGVDAPFGCHYVPIHGQPARKRPPDLPPGVREALPGRRGMRPSMPGTSAGRSAACGGPA